jgi:hypothetical protein
MTAKEKQGVVNAFERFLKSGCAESKFSKALYNHLHLHCGFIAHYNRGGFYAEYFNGDLDDLKRFFSNFEPGHYCGADPAYTDINGAMSELVAKYGDIGLMAAGKITTDRDKAQAKAICAKHGWGFTETEVL